eukprot:251985-Rhodomonas_salina.1
MERGKKRERRRDKMGREGGRQRKGKRKGEREREREVGRVKSVPTGAPRIGMSSMCQRESSRCEDARRDREQGSKGEGKRTQGDKTWFV